MKQMKFPRLTGLLLTVMLVMMAPSVMMAQTRKISLDVKNETVGQVMKQIEQKSGFSFIYKDGSVDTSRRVTVSAKDEDVLEILKKVFEGTQTEAKIINHNINLTRKAPAYTSAGQADGNARKAGQGPSDPVSGVVKDTQGLPIPGASVMVKGTNNGGVTDLNGKFSFLANYGDELVVSFLGYKNQTVVANASQMVIVLQDAPESLDEIVVVGYGSARKSDLIASVSTVKTEEITNIPVANLSQGLAGRSPGLLVVTSGGGINNTPTVSIRGGGTPLYVIDGMVRSAEDFNAISPEDIESFSILKDASATAMYGSRASNGIIQVTTKNGKNDVGTTKVEYDFNYSLAQPANWPWMLDSYERASWANVGRANDGLEPVFDENAMAKLLDGSDPYTYGNTNARKVLLRSWAPQQKHTARVSGGNSSTRYYASLGQTDQQSLYNTGTHWMKKTTFRLSGTTSIKPIGVALTTSLDGYRTTTRHPYDTQGGSSTSTIFSWINNWNPFLPLKNVYGLPLSGGQNPFAAIQEDAGYQRHITNVLNAQGNLVWSCLWVEGLKVRLSGNYRYYGNTAKNWKKDPARYSWESMSPDPSGVPSLYYGISTGYGYTTQAFIEYGRTFGKHSVFAQAGNERYYQKGENTWTQRDNYQYEVDQIDIGDAASITDGGSESELGRAAWLGQLKYNYASKYYVEGNLRYDGSDYFAPGKRWGLFFSGAAGWVVTKEPFMHALVENNILNTLKIRGSYGETGLDSSAGRFAYLATYSLNSKSLVVDGDYVAGFSEGSLPSPDLTWYTSRQTDIGFDFASLNNRLYGSFDYFYNSTYGYLVAPTGESYLNTAIGITMPKVKSDSEFRRAGIELQLGWRNSHGDFSYDIMGTFTRFDEMWAYNQSESESSYMNPYTRTQQNRGYYGTMYHSLGYYNSAEDVYNSAAYISAMNSGYLTAGDLKYADVNGDGQITSADYRRLGKSSFPRGQFGLNINLGYKGFFLSALLQGSTSFNMYIPGEMGMKTGQSSLLPIRFQYQTDTWTPDNTSAQYPRLMSNSGLNQNNNYLSSDFWLVDGAYLRLKDFQFGYDFKNILLRNVKWCSKAKLGISGMNVFTISQVSKYGMDPETGSTSNYAYPVERIFALTANIGF